ncbi:hypothetical protein GCM10018773_66110 [Streptomyces candidus]|nr:hypothetical protein GCM10018773_66110 [Streptomyces candidus]
MVRGRGFNQGYYWGPDPSGSTANWSRCPVCIAGALSVAITGDPVPPILWTDSTRGTYNAVASRLADLIGIENDQILEPVGRLGAWNDAPERTADEVIAALESAAERVTS